jgi:hypothetical protein
LGRCGEEGRRLVAGGGGDYYKSDPDNLETFALNSQFVFGPYPYPGFPTRCSDNPEYFKPVMCSLQVYSII